MVLWRLLRRGASVARRSAIATSDLRQNPSVRTHFSAAPPNLRKLLVANRGEIACRVLTTARKLGIPTVAVYSEADRASAFVQLADEAYCIGPAAARDSYLRGDRILEVAKRAGVDAIHPGYGFLSENAPFSEACAKQGVRFVGPPAPAIVAMGDKSAAKRIMSEAQVPVVPGYHGADQDDQKLAEEALVCGFPLLVKAVSGGGGKGMKLANNQEEWAAALASARREALSSFNDDRVLLERYVRRPRHVEVQVLADSHGNAVYLFDRDCSVQRRHQKIIEEAPAPGLPAEFHQHIGEAAVRAAHAVGYVSAGTVEFIVDVETQEFFFMEMNTRLQVEHPVTEAITGVDLVEMQLRVAAGEKLPFTQQDLLDSCPKGHSFEARVYAESPAKNFLPGAGKVLRWRVPPGAGGFSHTDSVRVDSGVREGDSVGTNYDPMIAKLVTHGSTREEALAMLRKALAETQVAGLPTNIHFLQRLSAHPSFMAAQDLDTGFIGRHGAQLLAPEPLWPEVAAVAAVARHLLQVAGSRPALGAALGPWSLGDSKRLWHQLVTPVTMNYSTGGQELKLKLRHHSATEYEVTIPSVDVPVAVTHAQLDSNGRLTAEVAGRRLTADALLYRHAGAEEVLVVWLDGLAHEFRWDLPSWSKDAAAVASSSGLVHAPMPGKLVKVLVNAGQTVALGQPLLVMEAMKMEHTVVAPCDGVVEGTEALHVGAQLEDRQVLLRVVAEPTTPAAAGAAAGSRVAAGAAAA